MSKSIRESKDSKDDKDGKAVNTQIAIIDSPAGMLIGFFLGYNGSYLLLRCLCSYDVLEGAFTPASVPLAEVDTNTWKTDTTYLNPDVLVAYTLTPRNSGHTIVQKYLQYVD